MTLGTPVLFVDSAEADTAADALGLDSTAIRSATALRFDGILFESRGYRLKYGDAAEIETAVSRSEWLIRAYSPYCPDCLAASEPPLEDRPGVWLLEWRIPFVLLCAKHHRLLMLHCPACGRLARSHPNGCPPIGLPETTVLCGRRVSAGRRVDRCPGDFRAAPRNRVEPASRLALAQAAVRARLDTDPESEAEDAWRSREFFRELRCVTALLLRWAQGSNLGPLEPSAAEALGEWETRRETAASAPHRSVRSYTTTPSPPQLVAAVLPSAVEIVEAQTPAAKAELISHRLALATAHGRNFKPIANAHNAPPTLLDALDEAIRRVRRPRLAETRFSYEPSIEPRHIPQLFWEPEFYEFIAPIFRPPRQLEQRRFTSVVAATLAGADGWRAASDALDLPYQANAAAHFRRYLERERKDIEFTAALQDAIKCHFRRHPARIDYQRLRESLAWFTRIDHDAFAEWPAESALQSSEYLAAAWAWAEVTSGDPRSAPGFRAAAAEGQTHRELWQRYRALCATSWFRQLQPALREHVQRLSQ